MISDNCQYFVHVLFQYLKEGESCQATNGLTNQAFIWYIMGLVVLRLAKSFGGSLRVAGRFKETRMVWKSSSSD